jgi:molybdate transport system substrate-binding protein
VIGVFPDNSHPAILYPIAITADSTNPEAGAFLEFLLSPAARPAFEGQGFTVIDPVS